MQRGVSVNKQGAHQAKEVSKATIRIIGTSVQFGCPSLAENSSCFPGISVEQITPDKKPVYIKLELDGVRLDNLPAIGPNPNHVRRKWSVSLWVFNSLYMVCTGGLRGQLGTYKKTPS